MALRSADLLSLGVALPLMMASPPAEAGHSDDLVDRLKAKFDLGEPKTSESSVQLTMRGRKIINGKPHAVELVYGFEENKPSGAFTLTINR